MTNEEASFCMKQYLPDSDSLECMKCPYYHTVPIEGTENGFTCKADEAHKIAIKALKQGDVLQEIRQEIEERINNCGDGDFKDGLCEAFDIVYNKIEELTNKLKF